MDNFNFKKYLSKNPLTEAYTPGEGWTADFEYDDMMAHGLTLTADDSIEDLRKVVEDFTDVNYHREAAHLYDAIDSIEAGNRGEAKMYINKFRKEIKNTLAGWDDVNEAQEDKFDIETTEKIAQAIADEFTAEDRELDLKYVVTPGTEESSFDLDVEAGPNTPGPEWRDKNGFSIDNYLGEFAGGSFYIKDGVVYNAASRNAPVANVTPEGEVKMISAADSRAAIDMEDDELNPGMYIDDEEWEREMGRMEENKNKLKSNKMKKSELKEMIKSAFLEEANLNIKDETNMYDPVAEQEDVEVEDDENVDVNVEKDVEVDVDDESTETDTVVKTELPGEDAEVTKTLGLLTKAQQTAKALGDDKLTDQIGNTITYFTRAHVARQQTDEVKVNEVTFPMWSKINK